LHGAGRKRCPTTGRALGGDARLLGQLIDRRYRIVRYLGEGPFGAIYKAEHATVGRHVALRILPSGLLLDAGAVHRFFREARLISSIEDPRLHTIVDAGLSPEGIAYVAYQYVRAPVLSSVLIAEAPLPLERAATIVAGVLRGLEAIHASGFVHGALSPESVLLRRSAAANEQPMLTNFGAGALAVDMHKAQPLEAARDAAYVPRVVVPKSYEPPERSLGAAPQPAEDIFAAGVMLAACLSPAGQPHFGSALLQLHVPATVEAIVARAVHHQPAARFVTAREMRNALVRFARLSIEDDPISVTDTQITDLRAMSRRERELGTPLGRERLVPRGVPAGTVDADIGGPILRALRNLMGARWASVVDVVPNADDCANGTEPISHLVISAALEEADPLMGTNDRLFCTVVGERAAKDELVALLMRRGTITPELCFDQIASDWAQRLCLGTTRIAGMGRGYGRLELRDQPDPSLALCACICGILTETLRAVGAQNPEVYKTSCEAAAHPACVFSATWS
jgi:hypothetical protein